MTLKLTAVLALTLTLTACAEPEPTTFVLENDGEEDVFHDVDFWLSLEADGAQVSMTEPGCLPKCGLVNQAIACAEAARIPGVKRLSPGDTTLQDWDGVYYEVDDGCYRKRTANADFTATFCYGAEIEVWDELPGEQSEDVIWGANVKDPVCEEVSFERGEDVELLAE